MYIEDLLYNGYYSFEMSTERNLNNVVCGICGVCLKSVWVTAMEKTLA
jgi:hypothetical protein